MKKTLISESERERILGMHYNAMGKELVNEAIDPSWDPTKSYSQTTVPYTTSTSLQTSKLAVAHNPSEDKTIVIPAGTVFKIKLPSKNFMIAEGFSITPAYTSKEFDMNKAYNDRNYAEAEFNKLKVAKKAYPITIAITKGSGGIIFQGGSKPLALGGTINGPLLKQIQSLV